MQNTVESSALLREAEVMRLLRLKSRSTIWRYVRSGLLPQPIRLGGATRWIAQEIDEVVEGAAARRRNAETTE